MALSPTGTKSFAAPEVVLGEPPAERNDSRSVDLNEPCIAGTSNSCKAFLGRCLCIQAGGRPAPMTLLEDRWLREPRRRRPPAFHVRRSRQQATLPGTTNVIIDSDSMSDSSSETDSPMQRCGSEQLFVKRQPVELTRRRSVGAFWSLLRWRIKASISPAMG